MESQDRENRKRRVFRKIERDSKRIRVCRIISESESEDEVSESLEGEINSDTSSQRGAVIEETSTIVCPDGWFRLPSNWSIFDCQGSSTAFKNVIVDGVNKLIPVEEIDLIKEELDGKTIFFWRNSRISDSSEKTQFSKIKAMAEALAVISTTVKFEDEAPSLKIVDCKHPNINVNASLPSNSKGRSIEELHTLWRTMADKGDISLKQGTQAVLNINWPEGSSYETLQKFLFGPKLTKQDVPSGCYDRASSLTEAIKNDYDARKVAGATFEATAILELVSDQLKLAASLSKENMIDPKFLLEVMSSVTNGVAAILAPATKALIKESVSKRLEVRKQVIPLRCKSITKEFLRCDPYHVLPCGKVESVDKLIKSIPLPLQVTLPKAVEQSLVKNSTHSRTNYNNNNYRRDNYNSRSYGNFNKRNNFNRLNQDSYNNNKNKFNQDWSKKNIQSDYKEKQSEENGRNSFRKQDSFRGSSQRSRGAGNSRGRGRDWRQSIQ